MHRMAMLVAAGALVLCGLGSAPARADHGWHQRRHHHGWWYHHPRPWYPGYAYYYPAPIYYPPPVYYAPPAYYPAPGVSFGFSFR